MHGHRDLPRRLIEPKSATSGKAGGLTEVERLKAAEPFGQKARPFGSKHNVHYLSKFLAQSTANPPISILFV
jgi:hypothetical protein